MNKRGRLIVVSGPSGAGKTTTVHGVIKKMDKAWFSISATTRGIRKGVEKDGVDYYFLTRDRFKEMLDAGEFLEHNIYAANENLYGTLRAPVMEKLEAGYDVFLDIDVNGGFQVKEKMPDAILVFLTPSSPDALKRRILARGADTEESLRRRLEAASAEIKKAVKYDYIVINDILGDAVEELRAIITAEKCRSAEMLKILEFHER